MPRYVDRRDKSTLVRLCTLFLACLLASPTVSTAQERLRDDPRGVLPTPPNTLVEGVRRFFPDYEPVEHFGEFVTGEETPVHWEVETDVGRCYAVMAVAPAEEDIDLRVREGGALVGINQARDSYPFVEWCAEQTTATVQVTSLERQVDTDMVLLLDPDTESIPPSQLPGSSLNARLLAYWAQVAPRWLPQVPPTTLNFDAPSIMPVPFTAAEDGCAAVIAVSAPRIEDVDLLVTNDGDFRYGSFVVGQNAMLLICGDWKPGDQVQVGVRRGYGDVRVMVLYPPEAVE